MTSFGTNRHDIQAKDVISPELLARRIAKGTYRIVDNELEKQCFYCKDYWPADSEFFFSNKNQPDGLWYCCKACYIDRRFPNDARRKNNIG